MSVDGSVDIGWNVGQNFLKAGEKLHFHAPFFFINCAFVRAQNEYLGQFLPNFIHFGAPKSSGDFWKKRHGKIL